MKRFAGSIIVIVVFCVSIGTVFGAWLGPGEEWKDIMARARGFRPVAEIQIEELRALRQQLARIANTQVQGTNALQRVAYLEQNLAAYDKALNRILQAQDKIIQQLTRDVWGLHERLTQVEKQAGILQPSSEEQPPPVHNPRKAD